MTVGPFFGFNLATNALNMAQQAEAVIGNNIANASTPGYTEEIANVVGSSPFPDDPSMSPVFSGQVGQGSTVGSVTRQTNAYYNTLVQENLSGSNGYQTLGTNLQQLEGVFHEPSDTSLHSAIDNFFSAWQTLAASPQDSGARGAVIQQGVNLANSFSTVQNQLVQTIGNLDSTLYSSTDSQVNQVNQYASQINTLNQQIVGIQTLGQNPNQLLDQRDSVLNNLAKLGNISVTTNANNTINVTFGGNGSTSGVPIVGWSSSGGYALPQTFTKLDAANVSSGEIWANVQTMNTAQSLVNQLNELQTAIAGAVNTQLKAGYQYGSTSPTPDGVPMFTINTSAVTTGGTSTDVSALTVPSSLTANQIAASSSGAAGDGSNATAIANLQNSTTLTYDTTVTPGGSGGTGPLGATPDGFYSSMISTLGAQTAQVQSESQSQAALLQQSQTLQQSVSGVNVNDETAKMIEFQNIFSAASKFVSIQNQMLQTLMQEVQ